MKKTFYILLSVLFVFSAIGLTASASDNKAETIIADNVSEVIAQDDWEDSFVRNLPIGEETELTWTDDYGRPMKAPKGGKIEWRWQKLGGKITIEQSAKSPNKCTVKGVSGGWCRLEGRVLDANGEQTAIIATLVEVQYRGIGLILNLLTGGLYDSMRMDFYGIFFSLHLLPYHYK